MAGKEGRPGLQLDLSAFDTGDVEQVGDHGGQAACTALNDLETYVMSLC
jgi:hypothetical protein